MSEKPNEEVRIAYLCTGEDLNCPKTICYKKGGECRHTQNILYAKNFYGTLEYGFMEDEPICSKEKKDIPFYKRHPNLPLYVSVIALSVSMLLLCAQICLFTLIV